MKKNKLIKGVVIILMIIIALYGISSLAVGEGAGIAMVSSEKIAPGENFYLILNLSMIPYNNFKVDITNTKKLEFQETTGIVSRMSSNSVVTSFTIDKSTVGLEKLGVVFEAPKEEGTINFEVKITSLDKTLDTLKSDLDSLTVEITTLKDTLASLEESLKGEVDETSSSYQEALDTIINLRNKVAEKEAEKSKIEEEIANFEPETLSATASIEVSKNAGNSNFNSNMVGNNNQIPDKNQMTNEAMADMNKMKERLQEMEKVTDKMSTLEKSLKDANDTISSLSKGTTYPGSSNNYLKELTITGYLLDNEFNKTTNDYFITVDKNVSKLTVTAKAEDSLATVTVEGNTSLKEGQNKIIINVKAEDGSVRTYRIYVTK